MLGHATAAGTHIRVPRVPGTVEDLVMLQVIQCPSLGTDEPKMNRCTKVNVTEASWGPTSLDATLHTAPTSSGLWGFRLTIHQNCRNEGYIVNYRLPAIDTCTLTERQHTPTAGDAGLSLLLSLDVSSLTHPPPRPASSYLRQMLSYYVFSSLPLRISFNSAPILRNATKILQTWYAKDNGR